MRPPYTPGARCGSSTCRFTPPGWTRWLIYFSVVQRKVENSNDVFDLNAIASRFAAFEARYNASAKAFD
jgi:hypothetical protein